MTIDDFRRIALSIPGTAELNGLGYPNFQAERMSFATIEDTLPVIRLSRDQQAKFVAMAPEMFAPASDGRGKWGSTIVRLEAVDEATLRDALTIAWRNVTNSASDALNVANTTSAEAVHDGDIAATGVTTAAAVNGDTHIDVLDAAADVADDVADVDDNEVGRDPAELPDDANRGGADMAMGLDRPADLAAAVRAAGRASCEPRDDLQNVIEQLQEYCRQEPAR
jgi:hypothetical protein